MSQDTIKIKKRIKSVTGAYKVTSAMKLVSTVKLKKWKNKMMANNLYNNELQEVVNLLLMCSKNINSPFSKVNNSNKRLLIIVSSTLGLCGSYNINIFKEADVLLKKEDSVIILGKKGIAHFSNEMFDKIEGFDDNKDLLEKDLINNLSKYVLSSYVEGKYSSIHIIYSKYRNSLTFIPTSYQILPLGNNDNIQDLDFPPLFEPSKEKLIETLVPIYVEGTIYSKLLESEVSEQASRSNAMENATNNAKELLDNLKIEFNKARQTAITQEIIEIVAAAKAV